MNNEIEIIKRNGEREPFNVVKLDQSLRRSRAPKHVVDEVIKQVVKELKDGMTTTEIYSHAFSLLRDKEKPTAVRYSLRRAIMDLGPSGFPFEQLVGAILHSQGYNILTGEIVKGRCADHEVDIVAYNDSKLVMVEAKYHNSMGTQTDLKVALYIKARFDDLLETTFNYGKERSLDEGWLITNTKFSTTAIKYAECQGIKIVGWNYPSENSLQDMIEDARLHPLTCLTSISESIKKQLLAHNVVLCRSLYDTSTLKAVGLHKNEIAEVLNELYEIYGDHRDIPYIPIFKKAA